MRIWDVPPRQLCRAHLLGEHRELHGLWNIIVFNKAGYAKHPETLRWQGKLAALYNRHEALVTEMQRRGYQHTSPLDSSLASGLSVQTELLQSLAQQLELLSRKQCSCPLK